MAGALVAFCAVAGSLAYQSFIPADMPVDRVPSCGTGDVMILMAQSVPNASAIPCINALPSGWTVGGVRVRRGESRFWLNSDQSGRHAVEVGFRSPAGCVVDDATEVPSEEPGMRRFEKVDQLPPELRATRTYLSDAALCDVPLRVRPYRGCVCDARVGRGSGVPAPCRAGSSCGAARRPVAVRCGRTGVRRGVGMTAIVSATASSFVVGLAMGVVLAILITSMSLRLLGMRRVGVRPPCGALGWGRRDPRDQTKLAGHR